jgi:1-deoxy-D-xylulose-5-phosphate reductoisomerase
MKRLFLFLNLQKISLLKNIAILGSTGSIGTQALEVIQEHPDQFCVEVLTAHSNSTLLIQQSLKFNPNAVVISDESKYAEVKEALASTDIKVYAGKQALEQIVEMDSIDIVLTALVGAAGLPPTVKAILAKKNIALANKETLVVAGEIITQLAKENGVNIYPVDSEHSAIFQCLAGEWHNPIEKIILTASGGPFRQKPAEELAEVTKAQALKHPNWTMGAKITIDSATLMNKGLEVIEAKWLFNLKPSQIEVVVHPQSIIHSLVQFEDGSMKAQLGLPDMKLPILYAMAYPQRVKTDWPRFNFMDYPQFTFEKPRIEVFRCLGMAFEALEQGGNAPCIINAANEIAVARFLNDEIKFLQIAETVEKTLQQASFIAKPSLEELIASDAEARTLAKEISLA